MTMTPGEEEAQRAAVVAEARRWVRTPYEHAADVMGAGVDCGMLLVRVFVDTGLCAPFDPRPYSRDWALHRSEEKYLGFVFDLTHQVEVPRPGDVAVYKYGRCYSHGGVVTAAEPLTIIHAYSRARMVLEEIVSQNADLSDPKREPKFFSVWATPESP